MSEHPYVYDQIMQKYGGVAPWDGYTLKKSIHDMDETELLYHYTDNDFSPSMMGSTYGMYGAGAYDKTVPWQWFAPEDVIVFIYSSEVGSMTGETIRTAAMATAMQNSVRNDNRPTEAPEPSNSSNPAHSSKQYANLKEQYRLSEKYGQGNIKELADGRYRFYDKLKLAKTQGEMAGARLVKEWNPTTGNSRIWYETLDDFGNIRQVRPDPAITNGVKIHYQFDVDGVYTGFWTK